jgi:hypothetical protein
LICILTTKDLVLLVCTLLLLLQNARNVLVCSDGQASLGMTAKVADLGLSRVMQQNSHRTTNTVGTMNHTAPGAQAGGQAASHKVAQQQQQQQKWQGQRHMTKCCASMHAHCSGTQHKQQQAIRAPAVFMC